MKILYGVQGTGNGHITRARVMARALEKIDCQVDYLFSGRPETAYFDMAVFARKTFRRGLTFAIIDGEIKYRKTLFKNNLWQFMQDVKNCDLSGYDWVISDYEPITAWACRRQQVPVVGIGHQYVFDYPVPQNKNHWLAKMITRWFAPTTHKVPLHWHHFDAPILPPIIAIDEPIGETIDHRVLVYLPFENQQKVAYLLSQIRTHQFIIYTPERLSSPYQHVTFKPLSRCTFQTDLHSCDTVIANAGFELSSEALSLGKKLLVRPLKGQTEQQANAMALLQLQYGHVIQDLNLKDLVHFLHKNRRVKITFPDVAGHICQWLANGLPDRQSDWYAHLWQQVEVVHL
ncbi:MJ1255/VC2487 family glycosyltransferase [Marinicella sediminis]|uniref:MJ1255/VC2487 family glycosyltransferase n=1 Tax=Marinicella sediminis TaxID=1792834 RepID=A0ABV7J3Q4_9GAMM|nr:MJ1255/VC2487 family glycosyltransferase [Marinicella sediminis]